MKRVTNAGTFRLKHKLLLIANALKQHHIGLAETDDGIWSIYFGTILLAKIDEREMIIRDYRQNLLPPRSCVTHHPRILCHPSPRLLRAETCDGWLGPATASSIRRAR